MFWSTCSKVSSGGKVDAVGQVFTTQIGTRDYPWAKGKANSIFDVALALGDILAVTDIRWCVFNANL